MISSQAPLCSQTMCNKGVVAHLAPSRGHCSAFNPTIPPLQVALSFACSVASLSHSPSFQLPGWHSLHCGSLADYLLGWDRASTCTAGHIELQHVPMSKLPCGLQELPPSTRDSSERHRRTYAFDKGHAHTPVRFMHSHAHLQNKICALKFF